VRHTLTELAFGQTSILPNWHLAKQAFGQTGIWPNWHLAKQAFGQSVVWLHWLCGYWYGLILALQHEYKVHLALVHIAFGQICILLNWHWIKLAFGPNII